MVSFDTISTSILTPGAYVEFDNTRALKGLPGRPHRALLLGIKRSTGQAADFALSRIASTQDGDKLYGVGSQLSEMVRAFKKNAPNVELWAIGSNENASGTAAKFTLYVAVSTAYAGEIALYVGGYRFAVSVKDGNTADEIASAIAAAVTENVYAPFTAVATTHTVLFTFRHKGTCGNDMVPYVNLKAGEALPTGVTLTTTQTLTISSSASADGTFSVTVGALSAVTTALTSASHTSATLVAQAIKSSLEATTPGYTISGAAAVLTFSFPIGYDFGSYIAVSAGASGVTSSVGSLAAKGVTNPSISSYISAFGASNQWNTIVSAFNDSSAISDIEGELLTRDGGEVMLDGQAFFAVKNTVSALSSLGNARNSKFSTIAGYPLSPDFSWVVASCVAAIDAVEPDPARPRQRRLLAGIIGPKSENQFSRTQRNDLLKAGISTMIQNSAGDTFTERIITTYNSSDPIGIPDPSYFDITTVRTLSYLRWAFSGIILRKYPSHKLADDGTLFAPGQAVVTPSVIRSEALAFFREAEKQGLVENFAQFKNDLLVERDANDRNRINAVLAFDIINGLSVFAAKIQFIL